jgi:hypothetical protein
MPGRIESSGSSVVGYYDMEAGECRVEDAESRDDAESTSPAAVEKLVQGHARHNQCLRDAITAGAACFAAAAGAVTAHTIVGAAVAISTGVACGAQLANAEASCRKE